MLIVDKALERRQQEGRPIRVGMIGAGFMGRGIALQISRYTKGMELVAIFNRSLDGARRAYREAGIEDVWIHMGTETPDALALANERGINARSGTCAVMYVTPGVTFHSIHKWIMKLLGKY